MTRQFVQGVFLAKYNASNYRALYGRLPEKESTKYTKDYFQLPKDVSAKLKTLFGVTTNDPVEVVYSWPTGEQVGHFAWSADRYHLKWQTDNPPRPWKLGQVGADPAVSLPGDTTKRTEADGEAQFGAIEQQGWKPWLVGVKLSGEANRLHLRVYFENPPANFLDRSVAVLPAKVRDEITALSSAEAGTAVADWTGEITAPLKPPRAKKIFDEVRAALEREPNVLLVGPPGTGKTIALEDLRQLYSPHASVGTPMFDPSSWSGDWSQQGEARSEALVFHPSYTYENFVAGLFPKSAAGAIELEARPGPLLSLSHWAGKTGRKALLILDEFNRGPAAAIFGDTLALLDKDKRATPGQIGSRVQRPYPGQAMPVADTYRRDPTQQESISEEVGLPDGLHIVAAMNSTDRSVAPLDAAMRRRFTVIRVRPDYVLLSERLLSSPALLESALPTSNEVSAWTLDQVGALAIRLLRAVNERIEYCLGEDFLLGHSLLWALDASDVSKRFDALAAAVDMKVVPTLRATFLDQDDAFAAVMNVLETSIVTPAQAAPAGTVAYWRAAPTALASIAPKRLVVQSVRDMSPTDRIATLRSIAAL